MDKKFDTQVQHLKYRVLKQVAIHAWNDDLLEHIMDIPEVIVPGNTPTMRCCVYKERAIVKERVKLAMGGDKTNPNIIETIPIACDDCPAGGYFVTDACRGCLAHRCQEVCPRDAIHLTLDRRAVIDKTKCIECGMCARNCLYNAIINFKRPCQSSCKVNAITMSSEKHAVINNDRCTSCGACSYSCPFGAIMDKSFIVDAINILKNSNNNQNYKVYAVVAPAIYSQFREYKLGQVIKGLKVLGFHAVVEAALGADIVSLIESKELVDKGFLISSCCPSFVKFIEQQFPELSEHVSKTISPMAMISKYIKNSDPTAKVIFIGPCTSKKAEAQKEEVKKYVDTVITFEELYALFGSREIDLSSLEEDVLDNASYFGRIFARAGGLTEAVAEAIKEQNLEVEELKTVHVDGLDNCKKALRDKQNGKLDVNFIEGMACVGGCIGGAGNLTHGVQNAALCDKYGRTAMEKKITDAVSVLHFKKDEEETSK